MKSYFLSCLLIFTSICVSANAQQSVTVPSNSQNTPLEKPAYCIYSPSFSFNHPYHYKISSVQFHNGKMADSTVAIATIIMINKDHVPYARISWERRRNIDKDGKAIIMDSLAKKMEPYEVSLGNQGNMKLPPLDIPAMTEPVTDLHTFLICLSPHSGICHLKKAGDTYTNPHPLTGNFASGNTVVGEDYIVSTYTLQKVTPEYLWIKVAFTPPLTSHLQYVDSMMQSPIGQEGFNNFQMVTKIGNGHYNVLWGKEDFTLWMKVSRKTGMIISGNMINHLNLKMKINTDKNYQHPQAEMPVNIFRKVILKSNSQ